MTYQELIALSEMYDIDIFKNVHLYEKLDIELLKHEILHLAGCNQVMYPDPEKMQEETFYFFLTNYESIKKITDSLSEDYNPIHNYDRYEEYDELFENDVQTNSDNTTSGNQTNKGDVSAFDSSSYTPQTLETTENSENVRLNENRNETNKHTSKNHLYGNIGVTTSQEMLEAEMELRQKYNLYQVIAKMYINEFILRI